MNALERALAAVTDTYETVANGASLHGSNGHAHEPPVENGSAGDALPRIQANGRNLRDVAADAIAALVAANDPPTLFVRSGALVSVVADEHGRPAIASVGESALRGRLARAANFIRRRIAKDDGPTDTPADPPLEIVRDILALGEWPFPALQGIIEAPTLRPDGTIISRAGYDAATRLFFHAPAGLNVPPVPERPTSQDVAGALATLREPLADFPFDDEASEANALALMITPNVRPAIAGNVPIALVDSPQAGNGKTLFTNLVSTIATGHPSPLVITAPRDDDEWRKRITSALLIGGQVVTIDNLTGALFSGQLAAMLTTDTWADRMLGTNQTVRLPQRATWIATGNNVRLGGDMPRRCYSIRLDAKTSRPFQREGFRHEDLIGWAIEHRGELIAAALTLARAWWAAGRPAAKTPRIGSFEGWARVVSGVLAFAGVNGFLGNLNDVLDLADEESPQWESFLLALAERFSGRPVTVAEICTRIEADAELAELIPAQFDTPTKPDKDGKPAVTGQFKRALGTEFRKRRGTRYGDSQARIERTNDDKHSKTAAWRVHGEQEVPNSAGTAGTRGDFISPNVWKKSEDIEKVHMADGGKHSPRVPAVPANAGLRPLVLAMLEDGALSMGTLAGAVAREGDVREADALEAIKAAAREGAIIFAEGAYRLAEFEAR